MVFSSVSFFVFFFPALFVFYFLIPARRRRARNCVLILFSLAFYACSGLRALPLILGSVALNYVVGKRLRRCARPRALLAAGIAAHLSLLFWFKYAAFFAASLNRLGIPVPVPEVVLPVGISFYTFQGISYLIDVYREEVPPESSLGHMTLYIALFPQLIAGPIVRYQEVADRLDDRSETTDQVSGGAVRFLLGLGKKVLLSNALAQIADRTFSCSPQALSVVMAWFGLISYALHIYYDFSGYSDMAIGLGRIFGFRFPENFNYPYISRSLSEFWQRWHMTLSAWFRDYLYIPLGGNRRGRGRTILNLLIVWAATGLWHGAAFTFLTWGIYWGILLVGEKFLWKRFLARLPGVLQHCYALFFILLGWVWFRAPGMTGAVGYMTALFGLSGNSFVSREVIYWFLRFWPEWIAACVLAAPLYPKLRSRCPSASPAAMLFGYAGALMIGGWSVVRLLSSGFNPFIYFRF